MQNQEYGHKKQECWEEFKRTNLDGEVQWQPGKLVTVRE